MTRILLFGGSFDPIHHGHLIAAREAAEAYDIPRVVLIPSAAPPHKRRRVLAPSADRLQMCRLATEGDPLFSVSDSELRVAPPNYTIDTVERFSQAHPEAELHWLIGADSLNELASWHRVGELAEACTLVTVARPRLPEPDWSVLSGLLSESALEKIRRHMLKSSLIDISATRIRERVRRGLSVRYLVPRAVAAYIAERALYT